jgi:phosphorylcholine metabolism protein LicD
MSICRELLKESCKDDCIGNCKCYKYGPNNIDATMRQYLGKRKHKTFKDENFRKMAGDIMIEFFNFFEDKVLLWPMFGTLLGIVREGDIIPHDEDIDIGFFRKDEEKMIKLLDELHNNNGFVIIRNQFKTIYTVWKDGVFIDLYLYEKTATEQISQGHRDFYNILKQEAYPFKKIEFRNIQLNCISKPEIWLERYYGKDWRTPK